VGWIGSYLMRMAITIEMFWRLVRLVLVYRRGKDHTLGPTGLALLY